jgi:hypothetical protein
MGVRQTWGSVRPGLSLWIGALWQVSLQSEDLLGGVEAPDNSIGTDRDLTQEPRDPIPASRLAIERVDFLGRVDPSAGAIEGHPNLGQLTRSRSYQSSHGHARRRTRDFRPHQSVLYFHRSLRKPTVKVPA